MRKKRGERCPCAVGREDESSSGSRETDDRFFLISLLRRIDIDPYRPGTATVSTPPVEKL
jgi:hypothetical protein